MSEQLCANSPVWKVFHDLFQVGKKPPRSKVLGVHGITRASTMYQCYGYNSFAHSLPAKTRCTQRMRTRSNVSRCGVFHGAAVILSCGRVPCLLVSPHISSPLDLLATRIPRRELTVVPWRTSDPIGAAIEGKTGREVQLSKQFGSSGWSSQIVYHMTGVSPAVPWDWRCLSRQSNALLNQLAPCQTDQKNPRTELRSIRNASHY